jgi:dipeptidyl-peptidase 9
LKIILSQGFVDTNRIAVFGWSYGGYMSLMLLAKYSNIFKVAIAGAPVVNWEDYDSGYTERYMGLLSENTQGYLQSSIRNWVVQFPMEEGRLVLIHSLSDENVHPQHTFQLVDSLVQQGKPYTLYLFPRERHGLRDFNSQVYFEHCFGKTLYRWILK